MYVGGAVREEVRTAGRSCFSPSIKWVLGTELRLSGLGTGTSTDSVILLLSSHLLLTPLIGCVEVSFQNWPMHSEMQCSLYQLLITGHQERASMEIQAGPFNNNKKAYSPVVAETYIFQQMSFSESFSPRYMEAVAI